MRLIMIRHGQTSWNKEGRFQGQCNTTLTTLGQIQAKSVALAVRDLGPGTIYSSPLPRALDTAHTIGQECGLGVKTLDSLQECNLGSLEGLNHAELREEYPQFLARWQTDPSNTTIPNGESLFELQNRAWAAIEKVLRSHNTQDIVAIVSHNFAIRTIMCRLMGLPLSNFRTFFIDLGSISVVQFQDKKWQIVSLNDCCHLSP